jgi:hypothetical protein
LRAERATEVLEAGPADTDPESDVSAAAIPIACGADNDSPAANTAAPTRVPALANAIRSPISDPHSPLLSDSIGDLRDVPRSADIRFISRIRQPPDAARARDEGQSVATTTTPKEEIYMSARITRWLERAGTSFGGAMPLTAVDASYGASWWGVAAVDEGRSRGAGRLPLVAAAHLPVF